MVKEANQMPEEIKVEIPKENPNLNKNKINSIEHTLILKTLEVL